MHVVEYVSLYVGVFIVLNPSFEVIQELQTNLAGGTDVANLGFFQTLHVAPAEE